MTPTFPTVIDNSMREAYTKCPMFFFRKYMESWDAKRPSIHLHAGIAYAKGLEHMRRAYYDEHLPPDVALLRGVHALLDSYGDYDAGDHQKSAAGMVSALDYYASTYPLTTDYVQPHRSNGKSSLEFTFAIPLPINHPDTGEPIIYAGRFDMLALLRGELCVYDDKTATQLGSSWASHWELSSQMTGYVWAAQQFGYNTNRFLIRGVSITTAGNHGTQEYIGFRPPWMIDRWYAQLLDEVQDMLTAWERGAWKLNQSSGCSSYGSCEMLPVCTSPNPDIWLAANFTHREYNPLNMVD